jgi:hypothetical protein
LETIIFNTNKTAGVMKGKLFFYGIFFCLLQLELSAQSNEFGMNKFSKFAKVVRLGNAYTGYARGIESLSVNTAGIADINLNNIYYSDAYAGLLILPKNNSNIGLVVPTNFYNLVTGLSYNRLSVDVGANNEYINSKFAFHFARKFNPNFSAGIAFNYYRIDLKDYVSTAEEPIQNRIIEIDADAFDINAGLLFKINDPFDLNVPNKLGLGFYLENILATKASYKSSVDFGGQLKDQHKYQQIRLGTSYEVVSDKMKINELDFIKVLFVFDAVFDTRNYEFLTWQPNYGIELTFLEVISLSYGRENEVKIDDNIYVFTYAYPVSRYGIGISLPLHKLFDLQKQVIVEFNYCSSEWDKFDSNVITDYKIDKQGMSVGLAWEF